MRANNTKANRKKKIMDIRVEINDKDNIEIGTIMKPKVSSLKRATKLTNL